MARKTTKNTTTTPNKKTKPSVPPAAVEAAPEVVKTEVRKTGGRKNGKPARIAPGNAPANINVNLEEEIRRRAYELYLQRRATAGSERGDENQDWLIAEREIRSRYGRLARHTTA